MKVVVGPLVGAEILIVDLAAREQDVVTDPRPSRPNSAGTRLCPGPSRTSAWTTMCPSESTATAWIELGTMSSSGRAHSGFPSFGRRGLEKIHRRVRRRRAAARRPSAGDDRTVEQD